MVGAGLRRPSAQELQPKIPFSGYHGAGQLLFFHGTQVILLRWPDLVPSDLVSIGVTFLEAIPGHPHRTSVRSLAAHRLSGHVGQNPSVLVGGP